MSRSCKRTKQSRAKSARRLRLETECAPVGTLLESSDEAAETAAEGFVTPQRRVVTVDIDAVQSQLSHLLIEHRTSITVAGESSSVAVTPRSTKKRQLQKRQLFPPDFVPQPYWSSGEEEALVCFLLLYSSSHSWASRRADVSFWGGAAAFVQSSVKSSHLRTGLLFSVLNHRYYILRKFAGYSIYG